MASRVQRFALIGRLHIFGSSAGKEKDTLLWCDSTDGGGVGRGLNRRGGVEFGVFPFDGDSMVTSFTSPDVNLRQMKSQLCYFFRKVTGA